MTPRIRNEIVRHELETLLREGEIDTTAYSRLVALYPSGWDWRSLGGLFLLFGALSIAAGIVLFLRNILDFTYEKLSVLLAVVTILLFVIGQWQKRRQRPMVAQSAELLAGLTLIGLTFSLGIVFSDGSGNWPVLVLIDLLILLPVAYLLNNVQLLKLAAVLFFVWFGGRTGYVSGWGAYWFSMNYPMRFLIAAVPIAGLGFLHMQAERGLLSAYRGFAKVWISSGLFFAEMALWLMSLFGNYDLNRMMSFHDEAPVLFLFNMLWALANIGLIFVGAKLAFRMLVGYGSTFLIIQGYTLFFAHLAENMGLFASSFIAGIATLGLAFMFENNRRNRKAAAGQEETVGNPGSDS